MIVEIWLEKTSVPLRYDVAISTYQKGDLFCIKYFDKYLIKYDKYPIRNIFKITERMM